MNKDIQYYSYLVFQGVGFGMMVIFAGEAMLRSAITAIRSVRKMWREE